MGASLIDSPLTVREGAAAMAMVTVRAEPQWHVFGFSDTFMDLKIKATDSLDEVVRKTSRLPFRATDCSLPMIYALEKGLKVDVFQVYTDNETYAGRIHPMEALRQYRKATGIPAKLIVVGMTSTNFTIADPEDGGALDVVGFDSSAPALIANFARG
jgi:60 kDa SS-A/Ro ribonucleoprotein